MKTDALLVANRERAIYKEIKFSLLFCMGVKHGL